MNDPKNFSKLNLIELERLASTWAEEYPIIEKITLYSGKIPPHSGKEPKTYYVFIVRICKRPPRKDTEYQNYKDLLEWTCESCMHIQNELERAYKEASTGYHLEWAWFNLEPDEELPTEFISLKYPWILYVKEDPTIDRKALDTREEIQEPDPNSKKEKALDTRDEIQEPDPNSKKEKALDTRDEIQEPDPNSKKERALDTREEIQEPNLKSKKENAFPCRPGTRWEDVKITLIDEDVVWVETSQGKMRLSYHELGMADGRTRDKRPSMLWALLKQFAKNQGIISFQNAKYNPRLPDTAKRLNKHLQKLSGIPESIYIGHYKSQKGYKTKIFFSDQTQAT